MTVTCCCVLSNFAVKREHNRSEIYKNAFYTFLRYSKSCFTRSIRQESAGATGAIIAGSDGAFSLPLILNTIGIICIYMEIYACIRHYYYTNVGAGRLLRASSDGLGPGGLVPC